MNEQQCQANRATKNATVIKKYANRRLYNTATSTYVTLEDLAKMVKEGTDFIVYDAKSGDDITRSVLTQIIFEEENKGDNNLLPINFLRQLIRFYGDSMQGMVPGYLEFSLGNLMKEQDKVRKQMTGRLWRWRCLQDHGRNSQAQHADVPGFAEDVHALWREGFTPPGFPAAGFANPFAAASGGSDAVPPETSKPAPSRQQG